MTRRTSNFENPLEGLVSEEVVKIGDFLIVEREHDSGIVADRCAGFFYEIEVGCLVLTSFDPSTLPGGRNHFGFNISHEGPKLNNCPKVDEITHYYHIPRSEFITNRS